MSGQLQFYKSEYFKSKSLPQRLKFRWKRFSNKIKWQILLYAGKIRCGWNFNYEDIPETE